MIYLLAPSPTEYVDLETFLQRRREQKKREKERKKQPLISSFFKRIKMEETNYDGDDENERYVPQIVSPKVVCATSEVVGSNMSTDKVHGNFQGSSVQIGVTFHNNSAFTPLPPKHDMNLCDVQKQKDGNEITIDEPKSASALTENSYTNGNDTGTNNESVVAEAEKEHQLGNTSVITQDSGNVTLMEAFMQTEMVDSEEKAVQTEDATTSKTDDNIPTEIHMDSKIIQTDNPMEEKNIQTENITVMLASKEIQTDPFEVKDDWPLRTTLPSERPTFTSVEVQTQLNANNIEEVDEIQIVKEIHSQPTQTDTLELINMEPIFSRSILSSPVSNTMKSPDMNFDLDSNISSCSKSDEPTKKVSAGLDMRRGEYKEVEFPPVTIATQKSSIFNPILKERTPSPMDLCTIVRSTEAVKPKEVATKFITSSISRDPFDDIPHLKSQKPHDTRLIAAHQTKPSLRHDLEHRFGPTALLSRDSGIIGFTNTTTAMSLKVRDLSNKAPSEKTFGGSQGDVLSFGQLSQTTKPETNAQPSACRRRHKSADWIQPQVQLEREVPEMSRMTMSSFGKEKLSKNFNTSKVIEGKEALKCNLTPKETSVSLDKGYKVNMLHSDNGSEARQDFQSSTISGSFTPKKVKGLKLGSTISRGFYGRRRYGTSRGNIALQNVKKVTPLRNAAKEQKSTSRIDSEIADSNKLITIGHSNPNKSSEEIPVNTSVHMEEVAKTLTTPLTHPATKDFPSNSRHGLIDQKKLAATTDKVRANLKTAALDDANSTLEFEQLENQQNTSHETCESSQIDDSKDSSYSPSKGTQESSCTEHSSIDQSGEIEANESEENMNDDDEDSNDEEGFVEESEEEEEPGKVRAKDYITINVSSGTLMSPKSQQKRISEYSQLIGKKGVRFSFAGNYPDIYYNPPEVQSNMKGFSSAHTGITLPNIPSNTTPVIPKHKESVKREKTPINTSNPEYDNPQMSLLERPQLSSTPKSKNSESKNNKEEKPQEAGHSSVSKGQPSDENMNEPNSKELTVDAGQEADRINDDSIDQDQGTSANNPNTSTQSLDADAQSSSHSEIADAEFKKIFKGTLLTNFIFPSISIVQYIYLILTTILKIFFLYLTDSDAHDTEPSENLLDLYRYKLAQLRDITNKVYNSDDLK